MGIRRVCTFRDLAFILTVSMSSAGVASAQGTPSPPSRPWEISFSGGVLSGHGLATGTGQLPPPGDVYVLPIPGGVPPTRLIPSWWFGDGARLFNEVRNGLPPVPAVPSIAPLDDTLQRGVRRGAGLMFGAGIARALNRRLTAEFRLDVATGGVTFDDDVRPDAEATRQSLEGAFPAMLPTILSSIATDVTTVDDGGGELLAVGALRIALGHLRAVEPYVIVGGGVARALGDVGPSLNLRADLRFVTSGVEQLQQIDAVTVTTYPKLGGVFLTGGGLRKPVGGRSAIRLDARVYWIGDTTATRVQTAPEDIDGPSAVLFLRASTVSITFSGFAPAARSSLSVPLENFETFTASGMRTQFSLTFGYDIRF